MTSRCGACATCSRPKRSSGSKHAAERGRLARLRQDRNRDQLSAAQFRTRMSAACASVSNSSAQKRNCSTTSGLFAASISARQRSAIERKKTASGILIPPPSLDGRQRSRNDSLKHHGDSRPGHCCPGNGSNACKTASVPWPPAWLAFQPLGFGFELSRKTAKIVSDFRGGARQAAKLVRRYFQKVDDLFHNNGMNTSRST